MDGGSRPIATRDRPIKIEIDPHGKPANTPGANLDEVKAHEILGRAAAHLRERAAAYDQPEGERSMGRAVAAFNAITGFELEESHGWLLLQMVKDARLFHAPGYHADSAEDCAAYAALKAEAKAKEANAR